MNTQRPVRLKIAWGPWSKGHVFTAMTNGQAQIMIQRGIAEYATAVVPASPVNRMMTAAKSAISVVRAKH
jgi:hypothetical protein